MTKMGLNSRACDADVNCFCWLKSYGPGQHNKETTAHPLHGSGCLLAFLLVSQNHKPFAS